MSTGLLAGVSRFAHLAVGISGSRAADDRDDKQSKGKKSKASDDEDDEPKDDKEPKGKKSKASDDEDDEDDEDDDDTEMRGRSAVASARRRERARCAAIFACKAAGANPELAASLAFDTALTRQAAIAVLKSQPAPSRNGSRQSRNPNLDHGGGSRETGADTATSWDRAHGKATGTAPTADGGWGRAHGRVSR